MAYLGNRMTAEPAADDLCEVAGARIRYRPAA
jgi:hypothetical protein